MATPNETIWKIRPHTRAKHQILQQYLKAWFPILSKYHDQLRYIDGYCGPGRYQDGEPGSPILALEAASKQAQRISASVDFWFVDRDESRIAHLNSEIDSLDLPANLRVQTRVGEFSEVVQSEPVLLSPTIVPTFVFVDPFGIEGAPFWLVEKFLQREKTELFVNFFVDSVNRFIEHPEEKISEKIVATFGTDECKKIDRGLGDRRAGLHDLYKRQLESVARFVRPFAMRNVYDRTIYDCFFATNNSLGHRKMKESMWSVSQGGTLSFSDAMDPNQTDLFDANDLNRFEQVVLSRFAGRHHVRAGEILQFVLDETIYIKRHMDAALRKLESEGFIKVEGKKADGGKRRRNNFSDEVVLHFAGKS